MPPLLVSRASGLHDVQPGQPQNLPRPGIQPSVQNWLANGRRVAQAVICDAISCLGVRVRPRDPEVGRTICGIDSGACGLAKC